MPVGAYQGNELVAGVGYRSDDAVFSDGSISTFMPYKKLSFSSPYISATFEITLHDCILRHRTFSGRVFYPVCHNKALIATQAFISDMTLNTILNLVLSISPAIIASHVMIQ